MELVKGWMGRSLSLIHHSLRFHNGRTFLSFFQMRYDKTGKKKFMNRENG